MSHYTLKEDEELVSLIWFLNIMKIKILSNSVFDKALIVLVFFQSNHFVGNHQVLEFLI